MIETELVFIERMQMFELAFLILEGIALIVVMAWNTRSMRKNVSYTTELVKWIAKTTEKILASKLNAIIVEGIPDLKK